MKIAAIINNDDGSRLIRAIIDKSIATYPIHDVSDCGRDLNSA